MVMAAEPPLVVMVRCAVVASWTLPRTWSTKVDGSSVSPAVGEDEPAAGSLADSDAEVVGSPAVSFAVESSLLLHAVSPVRATRTAVAAAARRAERERMPSG